MHELKLKSTTHGPLLVVVLLSIEQLDHSYDAELRVPFILIQERALPFRGKPAARSPRPLLPQV